MISIILLPKIVCRKMPSLYALTTANSHQMQFMLTLFVPGMQTTDEVKKYQKKKNIEILSNTENLQAVRSNKSDILQMIFYCAGEFTYKDLTVKADKACALMVKIKGQNEMKLHIADPGQTQSNITIDIRMRKQSKTINCDYRNSGIYAGSTKAFDIVL